MTTTATTATQAARYQRDDEVCPLCLGRYAASAEVVCVECEAPSCPDCVESIRGSGDALCFACHGPTRH
jgi:hypothetical protein